MSGIYTLSSGTDEQCVVFDPIDDMIVERKYEVVHLQLTTDNTDRVTFDMSTINITMIDDDSKTRYSTSCNDWQ